jgi:hypothetical protein
VTQLLEALRYKLEGRWFDSCRLQWSSGLRRKSAADSLLILRVRIMEAWKCVLYSKNKSQKAKPGQPGPRSADKVQRERKKYSAGDMNVCVVRFK